MRRSVILVAVPALALGVLLVDLAAGGPLSHTLDPGIVRHEAPVEAGPSTTLAQWLASAGTWWVQCGVLVAVVAGLAGLRRRTEVVLPAALALALLGAAVVGLKHVVGRLAPYDVGVSPHGGSFPSGHAATAVVVGCVLALLVWPRPGPARRLALGAAVLWSALVGWSRIRLEVHWTTDVLGGWAVGALVVATTALTLGRSGGPRPRPGTGPRVEQGAGLGRHAAAWDGLLDASSLPTPFLRSWWLDSLATSRAVVLLVVDGPLLLGGLALERVRSVPGVERYRVLGGGPLCPDHLDLLARPDRLDDVVATLRGWFDSGRSKLVDLRGVRDDADLLGVFPTAVVADEEVAPYEPLGELDEYVAARTDGYARRMRRRARQVAGRGVVIRRLDGPELSGALADLAAMHSALEGRGALVEEMPRLGPVVRAGAARDEVRMYVAEGGGRRGGVLLCFAVGGRLSLYQSGRRTDPEFADVGIVLGHTAIADGCADGLAEVDLLRGDESYKATFTARHRRLLRVRAASGTPARLLLRAELVVRRTARRIRNRRGRAPA